MMLKIRPQLALFIGSVIALGGALISQYGFGYLPCEMCIWQRIPYALIIFASIIPQSIKWENKITPLLLLLLVVEIGLALLHFGVEQKWWEGFTSCSTTINGGSLEDLKAQIMNAPIIRCDQPSLVVMGVSMAGWNVLFSTFLFIFSGMLWQKEST